MTRRWSISTATGAIFVSLTICVSSSCYHSSTAPDNPGDTTSHAIAWSVDTIGYGYSYIHDVAIIDDNNIWAVGSFYLRDSLGNLDSNFYNVLRWDGSRWNPQRLYVNFQGSQFIRPGLAVFGFASDDVWLAADAPGRWDGSSLQNVNVGTGEWSEVVKMWGRSSSDFYTVGFSGKVFHFDGVSFQPVATGVQSRFTDVFGTTERVYISSVNYDNQIQPSGIFSLDSSGFHYLFPSPADNSEFQSLQHSFGIWASPAGTLWAVGDHYVFKPQMSRSPVWGGSGNGWLLCIRGLSDSDVWAAGVNGLVVHYNGASWMVYPGTNVAAASVEYHALAVKGSIVVLGGWTVGPNHAIVALGRRGGVHRLR